MKQVLQNVRSGAMEIAEVPCPAVSRGSVLIQTRASVISPGTERMLVEFSKANLLQKARQKPEQVQLVLDLMKTDGVLPTLEAVFRRLDEPLPLGYCNAGVVLETGSDVADLRPGDRVVSNGPHAEIVCVPRNLCARVPPGVSDEQAAFAVLGSIALQGIRLAEPTLGEKFVVFGLGLVGLLAVQLLQANGCDVLGIDLNEDRLKLAAEFGARTVNPGAGGDPVADAAAWTGGKGVDGVVITAATDSHEIVRQSAEMCRRRGRIVLVGVVGLNLRRSDFYEKEISFQVSCSYGPGRHDDRYEQGGQDYPYGFVRWTEQRNFDAVLASMEAGRLTVDGLISERVPIAGAVAVYDKIQDDPSTLGVVLQYPEDADRADAVAVAAPGAMPATKVVVGLVGAGNFTNAMVAPALAKTEARIAYVASRGGVTARHVAARFGGGQAVTDYRRILDDPDVNVVVVTVQHGLHARLVREALEADKHVFVEKPLCLAEDELREIVAAYDARIAAGSGRLLLVGFNRRFSPHAAKVRDLVAQRSEPLTMTMTVNAGAIPPEHWVHDPERGGGRIVGEACHFIDLLVYLSGSLVTSVASAMVGQGPAVREDKMAMVLQFADGSVGTINYFANGSKAYPKERLEVFSDGRVACVENFRVTRGYGFSGFKRLRTWRQDKGHAAEIEQFVARVAAGGAPLIPLEELANVTRASFAAVTAAREGRTVAL